MGTYLLNNIVYVLTIINAIKIRRLYNILYRITLRLTVLNQSVVVIASYYEC